jgi:D-methionine transport system substrate-binding protein
MTKKLTLLLSSFLIFFAPAFSFALTVGVTAGPHAQILEQVRKELSKSGVSLKVVEFNDFILPNVALDSGDIDMNSYQHQPFLDDQVKSRGYQLASIAKTIVLPLGVYSKKYKSLAAVSEKSRIAIPNDPTNGARALLLLKKAGLIDLKNQTNPSVLDISKNEKKLKIVELEAPQLPRSLDDVDFAIINTDWVLVAGLNPKTALLLEDKDSPYANILVVKKGNEQRSDIRAFVSAYQSKNVRTYITQQFQGAVIPAW